MKFFTGLFLFAFSISACQKDMEKEEIPLWLVEIIKADEIIIMQNSGSVRNFGAWYRYHFQGRTYYEYDNPLSSTSRSPFDQSGQKVNVFSPEYTDYPNEKCCEKLLWKAPGYRSF